MGLNFLLFFVFLLLAGLPKSDQKPKTQKQYKQFRPMSPVQPLLGPCPWVCQKVHANYFSFILINTSSILIYIQMCV